MLSRLRRFVVHKPKEGKWLGARVEVMSKRWFGSEIQPTGMDEPIELQAGDYVVMTRQVTPDDVAAFARLTGDDNPIHLDAEAASRTRFKRPIAHGMLTSSSIGTVFGTRLPGCIYLKQELKFVAPVFVGDSVTTKVLVEHVSAKKIVSCRTTVHRHAEEDGEENHVLAVDGRAMVMIPRLVLKGEAQGEDAP